MVYYDEVGEEEGVDVDLKSMDSCRKGPSSCGMDCWYSHQRLRCAGGAVDGGARSGAVLGGRSWQSWSRSRRTTAG